MSGARAKWQSIDDYIAAQPLPAQVTLEKVRRAIRQALPQAEEAISYQMPAFRIRGRVVIYFAGWKKHYSLYPLSGEVLRKYGDQLQRYELVRGTIRFPLAGPVPVQLIGGIAELLGRPVR